MKSRRTSALAGILLAFGCDDERVIVRADPSISVCLERDRSICDQPVDIGIRTVGVPVSIPLVVLNRGLGELGVSSIGGIGIASNEAVPFAVSSGREHALRVDITPASLGTANTELVLENDDSTRSPYALRFDYDGVVPKIELCVDDVCGTDVLVDFGLVRRTQSASSNFSVKNSGRAPLSIARVDRTGTSDEISFVGSLRPGILEPGDRADLIAVYRPHDGGADRIELVFSTDDVEAKVTIQGESEENQPPVASALQVGTSTAGHRFAVEDRVVIDGSLSSDPEGDPLRFAWTLMRPDRSTTAFDDASAGLVTFVPDVAGTYRAQLAVTDSLNQMSIAASVPIDVRPRYAFRTQLSWASGGDIDLHLVPEGGAVFGPLECGFANPRPSFGAELRDDGETSPGFEEIVFETPGPGTFGVWVQYFDDLGLGAATADISVVFDDASAPAHTAIETLPMSCSLWHVGDVTFPGNQFTPSRDALGVACGGMQ